MKLITIILLFVFIIPIALATGICTNDKFEYHPGESLLFSCSCTTPLEENQDGFIVVRNITGDVLQNTSANSLNCRSSFFIGMYTFLRDENFTGNVSFEDAINWDNADDIYYDNFNVTGAHTFDCKINDVSGNTITLGRLGSVKFNVKDGITGNNLIMASCMAEGYDINSNPILFELYEPGYAFRFTSAGGEVGFQHMMDEEIWIENTTYLYEFHCHCLDNESDYPCYDEETGERVGFKSCTAQVPFIIGPDDFRPNDISYSIASMLGIIFTILIFIFLTYLFHMKATNKDAIGELSNSQEIIKDANWWKVLELFSMLFTLFLSVFLNNIARLIALEKFASDNIILMFDTLHIVLIAAIILIITIFMLRFLVLLVENFNRKKLEKELGGSE